MHLQKPSWQLRGELFQGSFYLAWKDHDAQEGGGELGFSKNQH
jgi:hypothetical protein